jgi:hypothetical protein
MEYLGSQIVYVYFYLVTVYSEYLSSLSNISSVKDGFYLFSVTCCKSITQYYRAVGIHDNGNFLDLLL